MPRVGRSAIILSTHESKILLDCGINISSKESIRSFPRFDITGFDLNELDAIVLSHAHLDHTGFLPSLFKFGFAGPVYCSEPTLPLMYLLQWEYLKNIEFSHPVFVKRHRASGCAYHSSFLSESLQIFPLM